MLLKMTQAVRIRAGLFPPRVILSRFMPSKSMSTISASPLRPAARPPSLAILDDYLSLSCPHFQHLTPSRLAVTIFTDPIAPADLAATLRPYTAISAMRERTAIPGALLRQLPYLRLLLCTGTQFETIDLAAAKKLGIAVVAAPGKGRTDVSSPPPVLSPSSPTSFSASTDTPDPALSLDIKNGTQHPATHHTWALILALARNVAADNAALKSSSSSPFSSDPPWHTDATVGLTNKTLGVVGLGRLGSAVARIGALAFGMRVVCWSASLTQAEADRRAGGLGLGAGTFRVAATKEDLFRESDVVTLHYVLSRRSRGMVGAAELGAMRPGAMLVNTSRAALVDEDALLETARAGRIRGLALDVFGQEPLPRESPWRGGRWGPRWGTSRVLVTPHMGYVEEGIMAAWYGETAENVERWLEERELLHRLA